MAAVLDVLEAVRRDCRGIALSQDAGDRATGRRTILAESVNGGRSRQRNFAAGNRLRRPHEALLDRGVISSGPFPDSTLATAMGALAGCYDATVVPPRRGCCGRPCCEAGGGDGVVVFGLGRVESGGSWS